MKGGENEPGVLREGLSRTPSSQVSVGRKEGNKWAEKALTRESAGGGDSNRKRRIGHSLLGRAKPLSEN